MLTRLIRAQRSIPLVVATAAALFVSLTTPTAGSAALLGTGPAGGPGGDPFNLPCKPGDVLVGVRGKVGQWLDALGPICGALSRDGKTWTETTTSPAPAGGDGGHQFPSLKCGRDSAVDSISGVAGTYVDKLTLRCRRLTGDLRAAGAVTSEPTIGNGGLLSKPFGPLSCSENRAAAGLHGRAGRFIDSIGLRCFNEASWDPVYHFRPDKGWMNDPAGLVLSNRTYHLYYQAMPNSLSFKPERVRWGHATSTNLIDWSWDARKIVALGLKKDALGDHAPYTGSGIAVPGHDPVCGCPGGHSARCLVAIFTRHIVSTVTQYQALQPSCDGGQSFDPAKEQTVLPNAVPSRHFRDPKVFWYEHPRDTSKRYWVMVLAVGNTVQLYRSRTAADLTRWDLLSEIPIYSNLNPTGPFVECPDLVELPVENAPGQKRWILTFGEGYIPPFVATLGRNEPSKSLYLVGTFDGTRFQSEIQASGGGALRSRAALLDAGPDYYAPQSWFVDRAAASAPITLPGTSSVRPTTPTLVPSDQAIPHVLAGWQSNWQYAHLVPTQWWRGHLAIPRELSLVSAGGRHWLVQRPVRELLSRRTRRVHLANQNLSPAPLVLAFHGHAFDAEMAIRVGSVGASGSAVSITVRGPGAGKIVVGWRRTGEGSAGALFLDRRAGWALGGTPPSGYAQPRSGPFWEAPLAIGQDGLLTLRLLVDKSSVEVFGGDGRAVISAAFFPDPSSSQLSLAASGSASRLVNLDLFEVLPTE
jgi:sucrose-6-phosphate hydrolase SacC (GH32 family)